MQPKLTVGAPNDQYEQEADRVADQVMRMPDNKIDINSADSTPQIQRMCPECSDELQRQPIEEEEEEIQLKSQSTSASAASSVFTSDINAIRGKGKPLPNTIRNYFEPRFGFDFGAVRVHTDSRAAQLAQTIKARAFTTGKDVVFGTGEYAPQTRTGQNLLAHELTHTVQQGAAVPKRCSNKSNIACGGINNKPVIRADIGRIQRAELETIPAPPLEFPPVPEVELPPRAERPLPPLPAPPIPETPTTPEQCPTETATRTALRESNVESETERRMRYALNLHRSRAAFRQPIRLTRQLIRRAERAIRADLGQWLPSRSFASQQVVTVRTPEEFARRRIPDDASARERLAEIALRSSPEVLRTLCISSPTHSLLLNEIATPMLQRLGRQFVLAYEQAKIAGHTRYEGWGAPVSRHVELQREHQNIGHALIHEAMHYYVHESYRATAQGHPLNQQLIEGGAEYLARLVIRNQLSGNAAFRINPDVYRSEFRYVLSHLLGGGLSSFALAYFQGSVNLLGLTRRTPPNIAP